jgi:Fur family ferric uptake transcriptional regulator
MQTDDLKKAGLKITVPRLKILEVLETAAEPHMSAEDVHGSIKASGEEVGLATVYRVLTQFEAAGIVIRHNFADDRAVFELNQKSHHDHMVCVKCNKVEEFVDPIIESRQEAIAKQNDFEMTDHSLTIYGICKNCHDPKK